MKPPTRSFHILAKPVGPICNLDCKYCFYLEKEQLYPAERRWAMPDEVLEAYIRQYIEDQQVPEISFAWQGGEPTLLGVDFFRRVVALQAKYANGKKVFNALQTNGTLLDDEWCGFLSAHDFLVGLSIDGPRHLHDNHRLDKRGAGTFDAVMQGLRLLRAHGTAFNTLTVVSRANGAAPQEVYQFLKDVGSRVMQFIPLVERTPAVPTGLTFAEPPVLRRSNGRTMLPVVSADAAEPQVTPWSVEPLQYGEFLCQIFDQWVRHDVGRAYVQIFDVMLGIWSGRGSTLCVFADECGAAPALEHNGDLYACDHFVYPRYRLGNVLDESLGQMIRGATQRQFGADKSETLPAFCRECSVRFACNGECPKHRFARTPDGEAGLNYLCAGYKRFLTHIDPYMTTMAKLLELHRPPAMIMDMLRDLALQR